MILIWLAAVVALLLYALWPKRYAPGPIALPLLGTLASLRRMGQGYIHQVLPELLHQYGGRVVQLVVPGIRPRYIFVVGDVAIVKQILTNKSAFPQRQTKSIDQVAPLGLIALPENKQWKSHRACLTPLFLQRKHLESYVPKINEISARLVLKLSQELGDKESDTVDMNYWLTLTSLDIIDVVGFGYDSNLLNDPDCPLLQHTTNITKFFTDALVGASEESIRLKNEGVAYYHGLINEILDEDEKKEDAKDCFIRRLLDIRDEEGNGLSRPEIQDEMMTVLMAGHETTANTLSWTLKCLSENPVVQEKLIESIDEAIGSNDPTFDDLEHLGYAEAVIYESLRMFPTLGFLNRDCPKGFQVKDIRFPPKSLVFVSNGFFCHNEDYFSNHETFDPERFVGLSGKDMAKLRKEKAFLPFGGGSRICVGQRYAMQVAVLVLARLCQNYRFDALDPIHDCEPKTFVSLMPANGLKLEVISRRGH